MLPTAELRVRVVQPDGSMLAIDAVDVIGDDLRFARSEASMAGDFGAAFAQAFGAGTFSLMRQLRVAWLAAPEQEAL